MHKSVLYSYII